jgi:hypothetical protein
MARMQYSSPSRQSLLTLAWLARQMFYRWLVKIRVLVHILSRQSLLTLAWFAREIFYKLLVKSRVLGHGFLCGSDPFLPGLLQLACPIRCVPASFLVLCPSRWMFYMAMFMSPWLECSISSPSRQSLLTLAWLARQMYYRSLVKSRVLVHILSRQSLLTLAWIARHTFYKLLVKSRVLGHGFLCGSEPILL